MAQSDAGLLALENVSAAIRKGRLSPQALEGILKGYAIFGQLGEAFFRGDIGTDRLSALLAPAASKPRPAKATPAPRFSIPLASDQERAAKIMGAGFVAPDAYLNAFRLRSGFSDADLAALARVPWTDDELAEEAKLGSMLWPHFAPVTLPTLRKTFGTSQRRQPCFYEDNDWWKADEHKSLRDNVLPTGWHLVRTAPEANSTSITWDAQTALIPATHRRTWALEVVEMTLLGWQIQRRRFLENLYAWCQDLVGNGNRSLAGSFDPAGLALDGNRPSGAWSDNALVLSRKPSQPLALGPSA